MDYYLQEFTPEQILEELRSLNLEKIHATITYYHHNLAEIDAYMLRLARWREQRYQEATANRSPMIQRLRAI